MSMIVHTTMTVPPLSDVFPKGSWRITVTVNDSGKTATARILVKPTTEGGLVAEPDPGSTLVRDDCFLNTIAAAKFLGVGRTTFYRLRQENKIPVHRIGGMDRFRKSDLAERLVRPRKKRSGQLE